MQCPYHNKQMRQNSRGWYCPTKTENGWCQYKPQGGSGQQGPTPTPRPAYPAKPKTDWDKIGKMKALCGMVNGMLSNGAKPEEITSATILQLNRIVGLIETASGVPASPAPALVKAGVQAAPTEEPPIEAFDEPLEQEAGFDGEV